MAHQTYRLPVSAKGVLFEDRRVWLRRNEREEWELPGGKVDEGEQPRETVERELKEELGIATRARDAVDAHIHVIPGSLDEAGGVLVLSFVCEVVSRDGGCEYEGEAGRAEYELFSMEEVAGLTMPCFYRHAIRRACEMGTDSRGLGLGSADAETI